MDNYDQLTDDELNRLVAEKLWKAKVWSALDELRPGQFLWWWQKPRRKYGRLLPDFCDWGNMGLVEAKFPCPPFYIDLDKRADGWRCVISFDYGKQMVVGASSTAPRALPRAFVIAALRAVEAGVKP